MARSTCSVSDCDRVVAALGYCDAHYYRFKKHGHPQVDVPLPPKVAAPCSVDPCDRVAESRGMCSLHLARTVRTGDPMAAKPPVLRRSSCSDDGCDGKHHSRGFCEMHYQRMRLHGSLDLPPAQYPTGPAAATWVGDEVTYKPAHFRVVARHGSASLHLCVNCGGKAQDWAYDHRDPNELKCKRTGRLYSADPNHYMPLCRPCHKRIDNAVRRGDLASALEVTWS